MLNVDEPISRSREPDDRPALEVLPGGVPERPGRSVLGALGLAVVVVALAGALLAAALLAPVLAAGRATERITTRLTAGTRDVDLAFPRLPQRSTIYAADGSVLARLYLDENRRVVRLDNISEVTRQAVLAIEDARFYEHEGVDRRAVLRAAAANLLSGEIEQGASTITQQLARNVFPETVGDEQSLSRKVREAAVAARLENDYSKDEILELYLNEVYLGNGVNGVGAAAEYYFAKPASNLGLHEAALLAGMIASPERYSPLDDREAAKHRRNVVVDRMLELGWVTPEQAAQAKERRLGLSPKRRVGRQVRAPYFVEYVKRQLLDDPRFGEDPATRERVLFQGGLRIHTTLQPSLRKTARQVIERHLPAQNDPEAALVSIDVRTGAIKAIAAGESFRERQFDLATQGRRQAGSAFKPFTLAAALDKGIPPSRTYDGSSPRVIRHGGGREWEVHNAGGGDYGQLDLWQATRSSVNTVFAQLVMDVGPERVANMARRTGIRSPLPSEPSLTLGTAPVTPLEMASAFSTFARDGVRCGVFVMREVLDRDGERLLHRTQASCKRAIPKPVSRTVVAMLRRVVEGGTGTAARLQRWPVFGKTGTTDDFADAWFVGCTRQICTSTWVGHPEGRVPMRDVHGTRVYGGTFPAAIWHDFMQEVMSGREARGFPPAPDESAITGEQAPPTNETPSQEQEEPEPEPEPSPSPSPSPEPSPEEEQPDPSGEESPVPDDVVPDVDPSPDERPTESPDDGDESPSPEPSPEETRPSEDDARGERPADRDRRPRDRDERPRSREERERRKRG